MAAGRYVIQRQEASIVDAVTRSIEMFEERHPELPPIVRTLPSVLDGEVDEGQLQLAVDNLLDNARKYAPEGTPYRVEVRDENDWVTIEVGDRGPGVARRDRKRVFQPFERGDDRLSSAVQGSGIGLSLVRHVANAHGGVAEVGTQSGGGACFRIRIPRRAR
jgi:two-component system phosphate regulon sensor histidine kinase PhoR